MDKDKKVEEEELTKLTKEMELNDEHQREQVDRKDVADD